MTLHSGQKAIGSTATSPEAMSRRISVSLRKLPLAPATAMATAAAGTVASLIGTRRPARPTIQRGKRSPHGRHQADGQPGADQREAAESGGHQRHVGFVEDRRVDPERDARRPGQPGQRVQGRNGRRDVGHPGAPADRPAGRGRLGGVPLPGQQSPGQQQPADDRPDLVGGRPVEDHAVVDVATASRTARRSAASACSRRRPGCARRAPGRPARPPPPSQAEQDARAAVAAAGSAGGRR